jgi:apolipoprotein N-acyltransferase
MRFLRIGVSPWHGAQAVFFGLIGAAAFPPVGLWPLALASIAGLLYALRDRSAREALSLGLVYGVVYGLGTMWWFFGLFSALAIPLIAIMGGYFGTLAVLIGMTKGWNPWLRAAMTGVFAVGIEWLRGDCWYLRFPWYTTPHALAASPAWIAPARWVGVYGLSLVIWLIAAGGAFVRPYVWLAYVLLPACALLLGPVGEADRQAVLFQAEDTFQLEALLQKVDEGNVDLAVAPEYAYLTSPESAIAARHGPGELAKRLHCPVVFGAVEGNHSEAHFQNVAAVIDSEGTLIDTFPKQRPVPLMHDGDPGTGRPVFDVNGEVLGVGVCYDFDAPEVAAHLVRRGATVLVVPTDDLRSRWWVWQRNHGLLVRLRAVENDRWVLRAVNTGRSEAINPHGEPSSEGVDFGDHGWVRVAYADRRTFALGGWAHVLGPMAAAATAFALGCMIASALRPVRQHGSAANPPRIGPTSPS